MQLVAVVTVGLYLGLAYAGLVIQQRVIGEGEGQGFRHRSLVQLQEATTLYSLAREQIASRCSDTEGSGNRQRRF